MKASERVRFWVVAVGPSGGIAFHIVGTVYKEGAHLLNPAGAGGSQVLDLATAQGGFVETRRRFGDHAVLLGACAASPRQHRGRAARC
ncbi:hypothetical protein [Streptomyces sp. NPDC001401]|uniref:hypothetical protein n=1 Tax=Streptomyces sp. NPDC001401 TaxID=3364570 RepID=UPI0036B86A12